METNKLQWKRIAKGEKLPCDSLLMKKDGTIISVATCAGVVVGQDAYYLPVEELRSFPKEESEDKKIRRAIKKALQVRCDGSRIISDEPVTLEEALAWLEKQGEQKPAWSEEDEAMWAEISNLLWEGYKQSGSKFSWDNIRNWVNPKLKSIRLQNTWKPTKEQIMALRWVLNHIPYDSHKEEINGLVEQLIKLYNYEENR